MRVLSKVGLVALLTAMAAPVATLDARQASRWEREQPGPRIAQDEGYRQGLRFGEDHGRRRQSLNFGIVIDYRRGDRGYRPEYGDRDRYRSEFRLGFERGYREAYGRYFVDRPSGYGFNGYGFNNQYGNGYSDFAFDNGFRDGYDKGLNSGRRFHRNDPFGEGRYRSGTNGFRWEYGSKDGYRIRYREGFQSGYARGYVEGRSYRSYR
jgi:hypothetical protein